MIEQLEKEIFIINIDNSFSNYQHQKMKSENFMKFCPVQLHLNYRNFYSKLKTLLREKYLGKKEEKKFRFRDFETILKRKRRDCETREK